MACPRPGGLGLRDSALGLMGSEHIPVRKGWGHPGLGWPTGTCLGELGMAQGADEAAAGNWSSSGPAPPWPGFQFLIALRRAFR